MEVKLGKIEVWTIADGYLESRNERQLKSTLNGQATFVEVIQDGTPVNTGDVVARFDSAQLDRDAFRLERDCALAREDLNSLLNAKLPLEIRDLEVQLADAQTKQADEAQLLEDNRELVKEGLIPEKDIQKQEVRLASAKAFTQSFEQKLDLTKKYLHPSHVERARATLSSAEQELDLAKRQYSNSVVQAPATGIVSLKPVSMSSGQTRTVRVGDSIWPNQMFMTISDMTNLVIYCDVYEAEITKFKPGCPAHVVPMAFPELALKGVVESIGSTARTAYGRASGQKFFSVLIRLDETDPRLRCGMSAHARVLSYSKDDAVLAPRSAIVWEGTVPQCQVKGIFGIKKTRLTLGMADEYNFEVIDGVKPGDHLAIR